MNIKLTDITCTLCGRNDNFLYVCKCNKDILILSKETIQQKAIEIDCLNPECKNGKYMITKDSCSTDLCLKATKGSWECSDCDHTYFEDCPNCTNGKIKVIKLTDLEDKG